MVLQKLALDGGLEMDNQDALGRWCEKSETRVRVLRHLQIKVQTTCGRRVLVVVNSRCLACVVASNLEQQVVVELHL